MVRVISQKMAVAAESVWSRFCTDLTSFLAACERQYGVSNESYTEYVIDHLSLSCQSVLTLSERLASSGPFAGGNFDGAVREAATYTTAMARLF